MAHTIKTYCATRRTYDWLGGNWRVSCQKPPLCDYSHLQARGIDIDGDALKKATLSCTGMRKASQPWSPAERREFPVPVVLDLHSERITSQKFRFSDK